MYICSNQIYFMLTLNFKQKEEEKEITPAEPVEEVKKQRVIKSVNSNQHAILRDILDLHNNGNPVDCDITYSVGNFYGDFKEKVQTKDKDGNIITTEEPFTLERPKICIDVYPQLDFVKKWEDPFGPLPLDDNSVHCIVADPPFIISSMGAPSMLGDSKDNNIIGRRFASYYPRWELFHSYENIINECYRVLEPMGILIFKSQNTISGSMQLMSTHYMLNLAESAGFYILDEFVLVSANRLISGKVNKQQHARKFHSYFHVLQKDNPKKDKIGYYKRDYKRDKNKENLSE